MSLIFEPDPGIFDLREIISGGLKQAATLAAIDFIAQENKSWAYYTGVGVGGTAVATGIPGAVASIYVVGTTLDFYVLKSPEGSNVDVFLDGVAAATVTTYALDTIWEQIQITFAEDAVKRVDFVNAGAPPENTSGISWMALGAPFTLEGSNPYYKQRSQNMALVNIISFSLLDDDGDTNSVPFYVDTGHTIGDYQLFVDSMAPALDDITGALITGASLTVNLTLPGPLKAAPVANSENQRGGNFSYLAANSRYKHSTRVPALLDTKFSGKSVNTTDPDVQTFLTTMLTGVAPVIPRDRQGNDLTSLSAAVKAFRRK